MTLTLSTQQVKKLVGSRVKAVESPRVLLGSTKYVDDIKIPGMLFVSFVRSSTPRARINEIRFPSPRKGGYFFEVVSTLTGTDLDGRIRPFPIFAAPEGLRPIEIFPMAIRTVRYAGEIVAAIITNDRYSAEDALEAVEVDYDSLEPVVDPEQALNPSSPAVFEEWGDNNAFSAELDKGDVERAFGEADYVLKEKFRIQRQYGSPMEPRGVVADYNDGSASLTLWSSTQWPHVVRTVLSRMLGLGEHRVRVITPDVGGGFGNKQDVYPEEVLASFLSMKTKKPVKWVATRSEDVSSTVHARDQTHLVEAALKKDGTILGLKDRIVADLGAFHTMSLGPQLVSFSALSGAYKIKNWRVELHCVVTNKTPVGAYRGFGQSEANFVIERTIDMVSRQMKLDPACVRLKNFLQPDEFPYETPLGQVYDSGNYPECLRRALRLSGFDEFRERKKTFNERNEDGKIGIGVSFCVESTGVGPSKRMGLDGFKVYSGYDSATVRVERSGGVTVLTGLSPHGQGLETTLSQVCADEFGIPLEDVSVLHGDTSSAPYGFGTWGSRSAIIGSATVKKSCDKVLRKAEQFAAHLLKERREDLEFSEGTFRPKGSSAEKGVTLYQLAQRIYDAHDLPPGFEPGLEATSFYDPTGIAYSFAAHVAVVEVDTQSGYVRLPAYFIVHDCGTQINPTIIEGQVHGGVAQGIAAALFEELRYDDGGQLLSPSLLDYLLPTSGDVPTMTIEHMSTPTYVNPLGAKGMGEGGAIAPPAAIANAIDDALSVYEVRLTETPVTPEKLKRLITESSRQHGWTN